MKKIILSIFLISCSSHTIYPITILPPEQRYDTRLAESIGESLGLLLQGLIARKIRKDQERNTQKAYIETVFASIQKQRLNELIGPPVKETKKAPFVSMIIFLLLSALLLAAFLTIRKQRLL